MRSALACKAPLGITAFGGPKPPSFRYQLQRAGREGMLPCIESNAGRAIQLAHNIIELKIVFWPYPKGNKLFL